MRITASALSDRGLKRKGNEDQFLIDESLGLYLVCDGMGGHASGEVAAERAIQYTAEYISSRIQEINAVIEKPDGHYRVLKIAEDAVRSASQRVHQLGKSSPEYAGMGTTLTMLMIVGEKAVIIHVGDSRLYLLRAGEIHQLTVDHTLANQMLLAGGLTQEEAKKSPYQHVLTRCIGPQEFVAADTLLMDLLPNDRLLLCSDGLSNYFTDFSVIAELLAKPKIASQPHPLIEYAKQSGGADNITAIVVETVAESDQQTVSETEKRMTFLKESFLGQNLSVRRLLHLISTTSIIQCGPGKELIAAEAKCPGMYIVMEGSFRVIDEDIVEAELGEGNCFGQSTLIAPAKSPATLVALEASRVLLIDRRSFQRLIKRLPRLGNLLLRNLCRHLSEIVVASEAARPFQLDDTGPLT